MKVLSLIGALAFLPFILSCSLTREIGQESDKDNSAVQERQELFYDHVRQGPP